MIKIKELLGATCISCLFLLNMGCQKPLAPEYMGFQNLQVSKLSVQESFVSTNLKFYNPNNFGLQLKKAEMDIFINDKLSNHYLLDSTIQIAKKDTFYIPVSLKINLANMLSNALQALLTNEVKIRLEGQANLKKGAVGFHVPLHYELTQKLDSLLNQ